MENKSKRKCNWKRILLTVMIALMALILLAASAVMIYANYLLNKINWNDPELEYTLSSSEADAFLESDPDLIPVDPTFTGTYPKLEDLTFPQGGQRPSQPPHPDATEPMESETTVPAPGATVPTPPPTEATIPTPPPTEPAIPTEPTVPTVPITQPSVPAVPTVPTTEPTEPTVPTVPTTEPTEPTIPSVPTIPTEPTTRPTIKPTTPPGTQPPIPDTPVIYGDHLVNILLVGQDRREGQGRQRSDTMILASFNKSNKTITLTSFMRDMYVQIPGYLPNRLNTAYAFGGMSLLRKTMELNFGVKVDGVVEVDFGGFEKIITLLGGVDVTLSKAEAKYLNDLYEVKLLDSPVVVGKNHLDAKQAHVYVQLREIDSDYGRTSRQRKLMSSLIEAYKNQPLDKMLNLLNEILPMVTTDMTKTQLVGYALDLFPMIASSKTETLRLPLEGTYNYGVVLIREGFCAWLQYNIDFEANKAALYEVFRRKD